MKTIVSSGLKAKWKFGFLLLFFGFGSFQMQAQISAQLVIPSKSGANFERGYYHAPLKVVVKGLWDTSQQVKQDIIDGIKQFGFTDTIFLFTPPRYPTTHYRDSIDAICKAFKVQSVMEISFTFRMLEKNSTLMAIRMDYRAYDYEKGQSVLPNILFGGGNLKQIKDKFNKAVPDIN